MSLLEISHLTTKFETQQGTVSAVRDVSYHLEEGEVLGIVGESGSGKSVGMLTLMGLLASNGRVEEGEILFDGENISPPHTKDRKEKRAYEKKMQQIRGNRIGMIFQEPIKAFSPVPTIANQLCEGIMLHVEPNKKKAWDIALHALEQVGVNNPRQRMNEYPHQLSGGMRQRAMIAMALSCNPAILIADEPTTALDVTMQAQVLKLMNDLKREFNSAVIFITHDLGVIAEMSDDVAVMYLGRIVEVGPAEDVLSRPLHPYTRMLIEAAPIPDPEKAKARALRDVRGEPPSPLDAPPGCAYAPRCPLRTDVCGRGFASSASRSAS